MSMAWGRCASLARVHLIADSIHMLLIEDHLRFNERISPGIEWRRIGIPEEPGVLGLGLYGGRAS